MRALPYNMPTLCSKKSTAIRQQVPDLSSGEIVTPTVHLTAAAPMNLSRCLKPIFFLLAMFSLFGCFKKKAPSPNIETWLEAHFPGQFSVLDKNRNFDLVDLVSGGKKIAVVADKADNDVQFTLDWNKNQPELGLDPAFVAEKLNSCRADVQQARKLLESLKNNGLQQLSVGVIDAAAYIQVFSEPGPDLREQIRKAILKTLNAGTTPGQTNIWVEIMEPDAYRTEFQDIIPRAHWQRPGTWQEDNKIATLGFERTSGTVAAVLEDWKLNLYAKRNSRYREAAYPKALAYAEKKLPQPFYLEPAQMVEYSQDDHDPMAIIFRFPYYKAKPVEGETAEPEGYVSAVYQTDRGTVTTFL